MAGVVRPWCQFVDQQPAVVADEHLDRHHADEPHAARNRVRQIQGSGSDRRGDGRRGDRPPQNVVLVDVLHRDKGLRLAVHGAGDDDRDFQREIDPRFENAGRTGAGAHRGLQFRPGPGKVGRVVDAHLPLAVVAETGGFQHRRPAYLPNGRDEIRRFGNRNVRGDGDADAGEKRLLSVTILADGEDFGARPDQGAVGNGGGRRKRNVLELVGDDVRFGSKPGQCPLIIVGGDDRAISDLAAGALASGENTMAR